MIAETITMATTNGNACLAMAPIGVRVRPAITNRLRPNGGVMKPRPSVVIMKTEKWIGCMPIDWDRGYISGPRMTMLGLASMNMPAITQTTSINRITDSLVVANEVTHATNLCGTSTTVRAWANSRATAMIGSTTP